MTLEEKLEATGISHLLDYLGLVVVTEINNLPRPCNTFEARFNILNNKAFYVGMYLSGDLTIETRGFHLTTRGIFHKDTPLDYTSLPCWDKYCRLVKYVKGDSD